MPTHHGADIAYRIAVATLNAGNAAPVYSGQAGTAGNPPIPNAAYLGIMTTALQKEYGADTIPVGATFYYVTINNNPAGFFPAYANYYAVLSALKHAVILYDDGSTDIGNNAQVAATNVPPASFLPLVAVAPQDVQNANLF